MLYFYRKFNKFTTSVRHIPTYIKKPKVTLTFSRVTRLIWTTRYYPNLLFFYLAGCLEPDAFINGLYESPKASDMTQDDYLGLPVCGTLLLSRISHIFISLVIPTPTWVYVCAVPFTPHRLHITLNNPLPPSKEVIKTLPLHRIFAHV